MIISCVGVATQARWLYVIHSISQFLVMLYDCILIVLFALDFQSYRVIKRAAIVFILLEFLHNNSSSGLCIIIGIPGESVDSLDHERYHASQHNW